MQYFDVILAFAAVGGLCVFFNRRCGVAGGRTPLLSLSLVLLWLTVFGVAGALRLGGWLAYLAAGALGVAGLLPPSLFEKRKLASAASAAEGFSKPPLFDFGFSVFVGISVATAVLFAVRQPIFAEWDELSFWGTASKLLKLNDELYTTVQVGWDWVGAQQPGAILTGYFFQFFGSFAPWKTFLGYDVLMYAVYAAVLSGISWKKYTVGVPAALLCVLTPYLLTEYTRILDVTNIYMSAYGDIPAGILAGGAVAWYYAARKDQAAHSVLTGGGLQARKVLPQGMWGVFPVLAAAGIIKENAFPVVLVSAGVIAADALFCEKGKKLWKRFALAAGAVAAPLASYVLWNRHIVAVVRLRESAGEVGSTSLPLTQVVLLGFEQLLSPGKRTPVFTQVLTDMVNAFFTTRMTLVGSISGSVFSKVLGPENFLSKTMGTGLCVSVVILAMFALAAVLCRDKIQRRRTLWAAGLSTLGFVGYYWVLILSYSFVFKPVQAAALSDYNRYVCTYYIFWFLLALAHLVCAAQTERRRSWLTGCVLVCAVLSLTAVGRMVRPQLTVLDYPETTFASQKEYAARAEAVQRQIEANGTEGKIFFVSTADNGLRYFTYCYELLPQQMDYSFGGGPLGSAENDDGSLYYHAYSCEELQEYLLKKDCTYIFLDEYNEVFRSEYASLFTDGLAAADAGDTRLYCRVQQASGLQYAPCAEVTP